MSKLTVNVGEEKHEVELDKVALPEGYRLLAPGEVPDGFYTKQTLQASIDESWKKRFEKLMADPLEARAVLQSHGVEVGDDGKVVLPKAEPGEQVDLDAERERIRKAYERDHVTPLKEQLQQSQERAERLLGARKRAELLQAAQQADVREEWLRSPVDGGRAPILDLVGSAIDYDGDHDMFAIREGDGFAPATKEGKPWADVTDLFDRLRKQDAYSHLFKDRRPGSSGYNKGKEGGKDADASALLDTPWDKLTEDQKVERIRAKRAA